MPLSLSRWRYFPTILIKTGLSSFGYLPEDGKNKLKIHFSYLYWKYLSVKCFQTLYKSKNEMQYVEQTVTECWGRTFMKLLASFLNHYLKLALFLEYSYGTSYTMWHSLCQLDQINRIITSVNQVQYCKVITNRSSVTKFHRLIYKKENPKVSWKLSKRFIRPTVQKCRQNKMKPTTALQILQLMVNLKIVRIDTRIPDKII